MTSGRQSLVCLATSAAFGGAETSLLTLLTALRSLEPSWNITVVTPGAGPFPERCRQLGLGVVELPFPAALTRLGESGAAGARSAGVRRADLALQVAGSALALPGYLRSLRQVLRERGATVVHTNGLKAHIAAALAKPAGVRLVWHLHEYVRARPITAMLMRRLVRRADAIVANSESVRLDAAAAFESAVQPRRIHNAVDPAIFSPDSRALDLASLSSMPGDEGLVRVGLIATFARWKGHEVFLDAIARLGRADRVRAYVIGGAVYDTAGSQWSLGELRERAGRRGLSAVVGFTGHIADVPGALRALDIVVHASTEPEPFGMVIAEGMSAGRVVVAARAGGAAELFEDGVEAIGYTPADASELAERLAALIDDPARRAAIGARARAGARERFSPARMAAAFREAYLA